MSRNLITAARLALKTKSTGSLRNAVTFLQRDFTHLFGWQTGHLKLLLGVHHKNEA
jgi:hypothetical protein